MEEEGEEKKTAHHLNGAGAQTIHFMVIVTRPWEIPDRENMSRTRPHKRINALIQDYLNAFLIETHTLGSYNGPAPSLTRGSKAVVPKVGCVEL
jgi:hypothetical protein